MTDLNQAKMKYPPPPEVISYTSYTYILHTWSTINKLPLNAVKCVVMHITRSRRPIFVSYHMGDTPLETITTRKHLGIVLSSNLEWGPHVDEVTSKAKRLLGFIWRTVGSNDPATMKKLFVALLDQSSSIVHLFGLQTRKVTNISWKGFRGVSLAIVFPVFGTQDLPMIPGSRFLIFPPLFPALIIFVPCLLLGVYGASMTSVGRIASKLTHLIPGRLSTLISAILGAELMLTITHCLFHFQEFGPPYPMMSPVKLSWIWFRFRAICVDVCTFIINCFCFFCVSAWFSETL